MELGKEYPKRRHILLDTIIHITHGYRYVGVLTEERANLSYLGISYAGPKTRVVFLVYQ